MAVKTTRRPLNSFDVTCVIGSVVLDPEADESAHVAAFKLIAEHGTEGTFVFPMNSEEPVECRVTVEYA